MRNTRPSDAKQCRCATGVGRGDRARREDPHAARARVGIVGLGYVGLPLAVEFAKAGFQVTGIDISEAKTEPRQRRRFLRRATFPARYWRRWSESGKLRATTDFSVVRELDTINICVPTPLRKTKDPDMSFIVSSCQEIAQYFHAGMLVILESTTYPGTTDEVVLPDAIEARAGGGPRLLPVLLAGTRGPRQSEVSDVEHPEGGRRLHAGLHRNGRGCSIRRRSNTWCR